MGAVLRLRNWLHDRSLWLDEILITRSLATRGLGQLVHPLSADQAAPLGWLWAQRLSLDAFGVNEYALRLVPLLSSLVALGIFPLVARLLIGRAAAPIATILFATSPSLIYFAAETKQYSSDVMCVLFVMLVTVPLTRRAPTPRTSLMWGLACGVLSWCAFPAIFVAATCGMVLAGRWARQRRILLNLAAGGALLTASVGAQYLVLLRRLGRDKGLNGYWAAIGGYPPRPTTATSVLHWLYDTAFAILHNPGRLALPGLVVVIAIWAGVLTARRDRSSAALLCGPIAIAFLLAAAHRYPVSGRLALFLLPSILMLLTSGAVHVVTTAAQRRWPVRGTRWAVSAVGIALLVATAGGTTLAGMRKLVRPDEVTAGREATAFIARHQQPGDRVLIESPWGLANMSFYGPRLGVHRSGGFSFASGGCKPDALAPLERPPGRVWILLAHLNSIEPANRSRVYLSEFETKSSLVESYEGPGDAAAYLLDFSKPPAEPMPPLRNWIRNGCLTVAVSR